MMTSRRQFISLLGGAAQRGGLICYLIGLHPRWLSRWGREKF
jgi:hypothetical protein